MVPQNMLRNEAALHNNLPTNVQCAASEFVYCLLLALGWLTVHKMLPPDYMQTSRWPKKRKQEWAIFSSMEKPHVSTCEKPST